MELEFLANGVPAKTLHRIPLFVSPVLPGELGTPTGRSAAAMFTHGDGTSELVFVGRMTSLKGPTVAVEAASTASKALGRSLSLTFIGDGPERPRCEHLARRLNLRTNFLGWMNGRDRAGWFAGKSLILFPSLWPEPFGLSGLEGAIYGVPCIAFNVGGVGEWLNHGVNGLFAEGNSLSAQSLSHSIMKALSSTQCWSELSAGAVRVVKDYTLARHLDAIERVLSVVSREATGG